MADLLRRHGVGLAALVLLLGALVADRLGRLDRHR